MSEAEAKCRSAEKLSALKYSYAAGNQETFRPSDPRLADYGCGLIALADLFRYLEKGKCGETGKAAPAGENGNGAGNEADDVFYGQRIRGLDRGLTRVHRRIGVNGFFLAAAFRKKAAAERWDLTARWGVPADRIVPAAEEMLRNDIPVILSVGPGFRTADGKKGILLKAAAGERREQRISSHYMTVTAVTERQGKKYFRLYSWGQVYEIGTEEFLEGRKRGFPVLRNWFSNILYIHKN